MRKSILAAIVGIIMMATALAAQTPTGGTKADKKKVDKEARKLAGKADETADQLGRNVVFCILADHTDVGSAEELRARFESLDSFPFGQFVAAVLMADRTGLELDEILQKLQDGESLGQIARDADVNMGEVSRGFGEFRSELARSMTNPPTRNCFSS